MPDGRKVGKEIAAISNLIKRHRPPEDPDDRCRPTRTQRWIIRYIYGEGRPVHQKEIEEEFRITRSTTSTVLGLMEQNGMIKRVPMETDARQKLITLTDRAMAVCSEVSKHIEVMENKMVEGIEPGELDVFFKVLHQIEENLGRDDDLPDKDKLTERNQSEDD